MMIEEFEKMTGIYPSVDLFKVIENAYYDFDGDKSEFCKAYASNENGLASAIQCEANRVHYEVASHILREQKEKDAEISRLKKQLEREQEWKPYEDTDNVQQADYLRLRGDSCTKILTDDEAKDLLYDWYGFAKEKVTIHREIPAFEINRHHQLRRAGTIERLPLYSATDWNYIRFDCGRMSYEMYNDEIRPFIH